MMPRSDAQVRVETLRGEAIRPHIPALAALRMTVFREWPYCYDGDEAYEREYLAVYSASPSAVVALAYAGDVPVGASTALSLAEQPDSLKNPVAAAGVSPESTLYAGESVLLPAWRGRGLGVRFFEVREAHARSLGLDGVTFCRVVRDCQDPRRPAGFVELDDFWRHRGYAPMPGVSAEFSWKELGREAETAKRMEFWLKRL